MPRLDTTASWRQKSQASRRMESIAGWPMRQRRTVIAGLGGVALQVLGCRSEVEIATISCPPAPEVSLLAAAGAAGSKGDPGLAGAAGSSDESATIALPWATGFEHGFCDYDAEGGFCKSSGAVKKIVTEPVHSGSFAAAYSVDAQRGDQSRCIRQGALPVAAYYGAWYYVPALATNSGVWNLIHFQGVGSSADFHWDISLVNTESGALRLEVFSYLFGLLPIQPDQSNNPPIPIGSWFHIEMYLKRAADKTGEVIVRQDGDIIFQLSNIITDRSNSTWAQWYVGNLATNLEPQQSTVYVDDITLSATR